MARVGRQVGASPANLHALAMLREQIAVEAGPTRVELELARLAAHGDAGARVALSQLLAERMAR